MDQPKLERMLHIMVLLNTTSLTIQQLANKTGISARSVYRYIDTMKAVGFIIIKKNNKVILDKSSPFFKSFINEKEQT